MKYCPNCGNQLPDDALFCNACGQKADDSASSQDANIDQTSNSVQSVVNEQTETFPAPKGKKGKVILISVICGLLIAGVAVAIILINVLGGAKGAVRSIINAAENSDAKKLLNATAPKEILEDYLGFEHDVDVDEFADFFNAELQAFWNIASECGECELECEIKAIEDIEQLKKMKKYSPVNNLKSFKKIMKQKYADYDFEADDIKECSAARISYTFTVDKKRVDKGNIDILVYKYHGDWFVLNVRDVNEAIPEPLFNPIDMINMLQYDYPEVYEDYSKEYKNIRAEYDINL